MDPKFELPTSNMNERLFSIAGHAMTNRRKDVLTSNFESQLFLYMNREYWGIHDVEEIDK